MVNHNNKGKGYNKSNNDRLQATGQSTSRESPICLRFNEFERVYCELPQNKCQNNRLHKCQTCGRRGCKSRNHSQHRPTGRKQAHVTAFDNEFFDGPDSQAQGAGPTTVNNHPGFQEMFDQYMERLISSRMEKVDGKPQASASYSGTQPLSQQAPDLAPVLGTARNYGMPAVTALPNHLSISKLQLGKKNILWTPITSAGVPLPLPLPLDTCCSLSFVSQAHADIICQKYPDIQFTKLVTPLPVAVATPDSQLMAIGMLQVPIVWETGKLCTFFHACGPLPGLAHIIWAKPLRHDWCTNRSH